MWVYLNTITQLTDKPTVHVSLTSINYEKVFDAVRQDASFKSNPQAKI